MNDRTSREAPDGQIPQLGKVLIISSGETSASGHEMYQRVFEALPQPIHVAILETPAGFELNSPLVAQRVGDFIKISMRNFSPAITVIPARRRDGQFSTDDADLLAPMLESNLVYAGAGSPTYTVRHLQDSLALRYLVGRHLMGATICLASAAAIAFGSKALPVYEIYKAGHELHWIEGLNFFGRFGLDLAIVTHWDNREGGTHLDTSRCFMGRSRMAQLTRLLPSGTLVLGIDEHTGLIFDFQGEECHVVGKGGVTIYGRRAREAYKAGAVFPFQRLGAYRLPHELPAYGAPVQAGLEEETAEDVPEEVTALVQRREELRRMRNWPEADAIRDRIAEMGYEVQDTREGPRLRHKEASRQGVGSR